MRERGVPCFERTDWLSFGVTTALALTVYLMTLAPEVTLGFAGIFSVGAMYGGVPHPPGYPLWTMSAWLFVKLLPVSLRPKVCRQSRAPISMSAWRSWFWRC